MQPDLTMTPTRHLTLLSTALVSLSSLARSEYTCSGVGYFPHPSDCSQFFRCTDIWTTGNYQQYSFTCAEGTVFDAEIRKHSSHLPLMVFIQAAEHVESQQL